MPLAPTNPFPASWTHCYHATFETATLRVPLRYGKYAFATHLPSAALMKHYAAIREDNTHRAELMRATQGPNPALMPASKECADQYSITSSFKKDSDQYSITSSFKEHAEQDSITSSFKECAEQDGITASSPSVSSRGRTPSVASLNEEETSKPMRPPIAAMSYDLAAVPTLADPQDLLAEIRFLEQCVRC